MRCDSGRIWTPLAILALCATGCQSSRNADSAIMIAHLGRESGDPTGMASIRDAFRKANDGYDVACMIGTTHIPPNDTNRIVFVQESTFSMASA